VRSLPTGEDPFPNLPHRFDRYELESRIGFGGVGVVYKARHLTAGMPDGGRVALKVPLRGPNCADGVRSQFEKEWRIAHDARERTRHLMDYQTSNVSVCKIEFASKIDAPCPFFTMEYLDGLRLDDYWRAEQSQLGWSGPARVVERVARLMAQLHQPVADKQGATKPGILHLDLKPSNIIARCVAGRPEHELVVIDFGLAQEIDPSAPPQPGAWAGSPGYMPPEQLIPRWRGNALTPLSDVYALGAVLYKLLVGQLPYNATGAGTNYDEAVFRALNEQLREPGRLNPLFSDYDAVCRRALARNPQDRFTTMSEFANALAVLSLNSQSHARTDRARE
jgi:eukaryotic-like serine/threonine-protein kinase